MIEQGKKLITGVMVRRARAIRHQTTARVGDLRRVETFHGAQGHQGNNTVGWPTKKPN